MNDLYGTEESFETIKEVAVENMLIVFAIDYDLVIPNRCFYPCVSYNELLEKEEELKRSNVRVEWDY